MPAVDVAMQRSLGAGFAELLVASLRPVLEHRDVFKDAQGQISDVKTAFSSWDNCMQAVYCKWPVIGIIIVGGLILFSVAWCIIRCACCGVSCCCECFQCFKCCGNCCGCCDPPKQKHKYLDEPFIPPHHASGYKSHDPMVPGPAAPFPAAPFTNRSVTAFEPPQYAEFDVSKKGGAAQGHEDALPAMPSWDRAGKKKVLVEGEEVEMDQLKKPELNAAGSGTMNGQNVPLMTGARAIPGPVSPVPSPSNRSPYSPPGSTAVGGGYMAATNTQGGMAAGGYRQGGNSGQDGYQNPNAYGQKQAYDVAPPAATGYGGYNQTRQDPYDAYNQAQNQGYGRAQGQRSPPQGYPARQNTGGYPPPGPVRQNTGGYPPERLTRSPAPISPTPNYNQNRSPDPQRQHTYNMREPTVPTSDSSAPGFDSNPGSGYTRPARSTPANEYARSRPPRDNGYGNQQQPLWQQAGAYQNQGYRGWQ